MPSELTTPAWLAIASTNNGTTPAPGVRVSRRSKTNSRCPSAPKAARLPTWKVRPLLISCGALPRWGRPRQPRCQKSRVVYAAIFVQSTDGLFQDASSAPHFILRVSSAETTWSSLAERRASEAERLGHAQGQYPAARKGYRPRSFIVPRSRADAKRRSTSGPLCEVMHHAAR